MLNPLAFDSEEEFKKALMKEGLARGWKPIVRETDNVATHGESAVVDILKHQVSDKTGLAIVAIPAEDDYVNKISSEQVPHMTLLFLGDASKVKNISKIVNFVEHASKGLNRFCLEVDRRGTLGPNLADVLYFANRKWSGFEEIRNFRSNLLKDNNTRIAYDSVEQFPEWIPHLTLGFPDTPANPDQRDFTKFYYVDFDKIAVWTGDFEGPEFNLKSWGLEAGSSPMYMSETTSIIGRILSHHGVKGQKWGVRKASDKNQRSGPPSKKDLRKEASDPFQKKFRVGKTKGDFEDARKDMAWIKKTHGAKLSGFRHRLTGATVNDITTEASKKMRGDVKAINKKPEYKTREARKAIKKYKGWMDAPDPIAKKYNKEVSNAYMNSVKAVAPKHLKVSPSGKWEDELIVGKGYWYVGLKRTDGAKHSTISDPDLAILVRPVYDDDGYLIDVELIDDTDDMAQSAIHDILSHHGVKGQKWGVRKNRSDVTVVDKGKRLKTSGGEGIKADPSAVRARVIGQKAKGSGLKALTDEELKTYANRLNLEQNVKRLQFEDKPAIQKFILRLLGQTGKNSVNAASNELVVQRVRRAVSGS